MTSVIFLRDSSFGYVGFSVSGHSGYAEEGSDIICAAVSACCELVISQLCDSFGFDIDVTVDPKNTFVGCDSRKSCLSNEARCIISSILDGFKRTVDELQIQYPCFIKCTLTEV